MKDLEKDFENYQILFDFYREDFQGMGLHAYAQIFDKIYEKLKTHKLLNHAIERAKKNTGNTT